jgi:hypothetical protein
MGEQANDNSKSDDAGDEQQERQMATPQVRRPQTIEILPQELSGYERAQYERYDSNSSSDTDLE